MAPPFFKVFIKFIACFVDQVKKLGEHSDEKIEKFLA